MHTLLREWGGSEDQFPAREPDEGEITYDQAVEIACQAVMDEEKLTERRQKPASRRALDEAEKKAGLMRFLRHSGGENNLAGKTSSNLFEAAIAGIYLDGGMAAAKQFIGRFLCETEEENYKSLLQELVQERARRVPEYDVREAETGFFCTVSALGKSAQGSGESKKAAETAAAKALYQKLL